jgi:hypothetical protein
MILRGFPPLVAAVMSILAVAGCTTDERGRVWLSRMVRSERPALRVAQCISAEWRRFSALVNVTPYQRGQAVRIIHPDLGVIFQAIVLPMEKGSIATLGTPFQKQFPNYQPSVERCVRPV